MTTFVNYGYELEVATTNLLSNEIGESGTMYSLGIKLIEKEPPQPDGGIPQLYNLTGTGAGFQLPYIGVTAMAGKAEWLATRTLGVEHEIRIRCLCEKSSAYDSKKLAQDMANLACKAVAGKHGAIWGTSNCQVLVNGWDTDASDVGEEDNPYLAQCIGTVRVTVVHTD